MKKDNNTNGIPFYETDIKDRILKKLDDADITYKDFGMESVMEDGASTADVYYHIRFETFNHIEIHRDKFIVYLGVDSEEYDTEEEFFEVLNEIIDVWKAGYCPEFKFIHEAEEED